MSPVHDLKVLISSFYSLIVIENPEEERIRYVLNSASTQLGVPVLEWSSAQGLRGLAFENQDVTLNPDSVLEYLKEHQGEVIVWLKDFSKELDNKIVARHLRELIKRYQKNRSTVVITGPQVKLNDELKHLALYYDLKFPDRMEYRKVLTDVYESLRKTNKVSLDLQKDDISKFLDLLRGMTLQQARQIAALAFLSDGSFGANDLSLVEEKKVQVIKEDGLLEYYPVNQNAFELGGLDKFKAWLTKTEAGFSQEARNMKLPQPRGVLLVGVPGCGKSLAAKFVARLWKMPLLKLDAGRLYNKFIGESERNFRRAMQLSESISPCVLWIDEIEKTIAVSSSGSDMDGGVSKRILGNFLTWLQEKSAPVFVVATANDLFSLPAELMRKGRFDEVFFVDLPNEEERAQIFKIHFQLRNCTLNDDKMKEIVALTSGFSGSEIEQVVVSAALTAIQNKGQMSFNSLKEEIANTIPLSQSRAEYVDKIRAKGAEFRSVR